MKNILIAVGLSLSCLAGLAQDVSVTTTAASRLLLKQPTVDAMVNTLQVVSTSSVAPLGISASYNRFNAALCSNGVITTWAKAIGGDYVTGVNAAYGTSPWIPVVPGQTYCLSIRVNVSTTYVQYYGYLFADANFKAMGTCPAIPNYPAANGVTLSALQRGDRWCTTFTLSPDCGIYYMKFNWNTMPADLYADFTNTAQFEVGTTFTTYMPYRAGSAFDPRQPVTSSKITAPIHVIRSNDLVYVRTAWTSASDLVTGVDLQSTATTPYNGCLRLIDYSSTPISTTDTNMALSFLKYRDDDICPILTTDGYIGANHGWNFVVQATVAGHNKTTVDVGSLWTDVGGQVCELVGIYDANNLWFVVTNNTSAFGRSTTIASPLTHLSGATHASSVSWSTSSVQQFYPSVRQVEKSVYVDGIKVTNLAGIWGGRNVTANNVYDILDFNAMLKYFRTNVGSSTVTVTNSSIQSIARASVTYQFNENGATTVYYSLEGKTNLGINYIGVVQSRTIDPPSGGKLYDYVPGVAPITVGATTYNLSGIADVTSIPTAFYVTSNYWLSNVPSHYVQWSTDSAGVKQFGNAIGYNTIMGSAANRSNLCNSSQFIYTTGKLYPQFSTTSLSSNSVLDVVAYQCPLNFETYTNTATCWYMAGDTGYLRADFHTNFCGYLALPEKLRGREVTVLEAGPNSKVDSLITTALGLHVSVTNNYGYISVKLK